MALLLVEGAIHLQQYEGPLNAVSTINTPFVLNAVGAAAIALVLAASRERVAVLDALAGLGLTLGALVSLAISRASTLFDYTEPMLERRSRSLRSSSSPRCSLCRASCSLACARLALSDSGLRLHAQVASLVYTRRHIYLTVRRRPLCF